MAYTAEDAVKTFLDYLEINEIQVTFLPETKKRGIIFNDAVIFVCPVSYSAYNDKGFFDTRDSGVKERFITWSYAHKRNMKYFCIAVQNEVDRYKDYIFSLECSEQQIQNCSGKVSLFEKERSGTQIVIPRTFKPQKDFERIKTDYGFYISASKRKNFLNYMNIFDNRPYEIDIEEQEENKMSEENITNQIDKPFNRIVFGAPGTGKSNRLKEEAKNFFYTEKTNLFKVILSEIKSSLSMNNNDMGKTAIIIGMKYMYYFAELLKTMDADQISERIGITNNILGGHALYDMYRPAKTLNQNISYTFTSSIERVTFHPNYSYAQFVGTYKPVTINADVNPNITKEQQGVLNILKDTTKTGQEKYDLLYESFKQSNLTRLPLLLGIYTDDDFKTKKADGSPASNDNDVERNHGRAIRPYVNIQEKKSNNEITYEFVPGPFIRTYIKAKKTGQNVLLLIEEINRANVAAVFGDMFQLLDRDADGNSEYPITTSEDLRKFLAKPENLGGTPDDYKTLSIPSNMYIWATMNSADQGVLPMDAAFKRRWDFEYIGIDDNENWDYEIPLPNEGSINWNILRKAINAKLKTISGINEDKLLGPYFISKSILDKFEKDKSPTENEKTNFINIFKSKVLMYLFEDVCKMRPTDLFSNITGLEEGQTRPHYSDICKSFDKNGIEIFGFKKSEIEEKYKNNSNKVNEDSSAEQ